MCINYEMTCCINCLVKSLPSYVSGAETVLEEPSMVTEWKLQRLRQKEYIMVSFALLHTNRQSRWYTCRGRNNGRSSVNFQAFFKMTAHFSTCSVSVTDHVRIIAQLVYLIMELGRIFVRTNLKLTEEFEVDTNEITKRCPESDLAGHLHR